MQTHHIPAASIIGLVLLLSVVGGAVAQVEEDPGDASASSVGTVIADAVMEAWDTREDRAIETVYAPDVAMILDGDIVAADRDEIANVIAQARGIGNSYLQIGPVAEYEGSDGDLYVATLVEVTGVGHPKGVPVVGFYRVHDGKVIRHVFMDAEHY